MIPVSATNNQRWEHMLQLFWNVSSIVFHFRVCMNHVFVVLTHLMDLGNHNDTDNTNAIPAVCVEAYADNSDGIQI